MKRTLLFALLLAAGPLARAQAQPDESSVREEIAATWQAYIPAWEQGDAAVLADFIVEDAIFVQFGGAVQIGRSAFEALVLEMNSDTSVEVLDQTTNEIVVHGDFVTEMGRLRQRWTPVQGEPRVTDNPYVSVFQKQADGSWKWFRWLGLSD